MPHYVREGAIVGWGPTVQEIDHLAELFTEVRHIACLHNEKAPASSLPYVSKRVEVLPLKPTGGTRLRDKFTILRLAPHYLHTIWKELPHADVVHIRCPANIPLLAIVVLAFARHPDKRWVKYAGNWRPFGPTAWSYTFQRWFLQHNMHRGIVTVNGKWPDQPQHIFSFYNPCLSEQELVVAQKVASDKQLVKPIRLLFVGNLNKSKGVGRALEILARLRRRDLDVTLDLAGDGPNRSDFIQLAQRLGVTDRAVFHGWLPRPALAPLYEKAHFMLFPSDSEGWPKVLSEGMAYGAVPVAGAVSSIPQILEQLAVGVACPPQDLEAFVSVIENYVAHPERWKKESLLGITSAQYFSYKSYLDAVCSMFEQKWGIGLRSQKKIVREAESVNCPTLGLAEHQQANEQCDGGSWG